VIVGVCGKMDVRILLSGVAIGTVKAQMFVMGFGEVLGCARIMIIMAQEIVGGNLGILAVGVLDLLPLPQRKLAGDVLLMGVVNRV
tara:strand:- start:147 stop:404 length:258 start_codon:yes stop_codon:yes gene_type:complete